MNHAEHLIQISIVDYLRHALRGLPATFYAVPNGGRRDAREAGRLFAEGVRAGVADIVVQYRLADGSALVVGFEVKAPKKYQSKTQKEWQPEFEAAGGVYAVVRSIEEVADALVKVGVPIRARPSRRPGVLYDTH
jgi:hypothetical protein